MLQLAFCFSFENTALLVAGINGEVFAGLLLDLLLWMYSGLRLSWAKFVLPSTRAKKWISFLEFRPDCITLGLCLGYWAGLLLITQSQIPPWELRLIEFGVQLEWMRRNTDAPYWGLSCFRASWRGGRGRGRALKKALIPLWRSLAAVGWQPEVIGLGEG